MKTFSYGFPKLGEKREFKTALEKFWKGSIKEDELIKEMKELELKRASIYKENVDEFCSNELSYYDFMLDSAVMFNAIPSRFGDYFGLKTYFDMARSDKALEMTKWFNTNYHYLVPELENTNFKLFKNFPLESYGFHKENGFETKPYIIGPFTFLKLSKALIKKDNSPFSVLELEKLQTQKDWDIFLEPLLKAYKDLLLSLKNAGVNRVVLAEPGFVFDLKDFEKEIIKTSYNYLKGILDIELLTYYDSVSDYDLYISLDVKALSFDLCSNKENIQNLLSREFPKDKELVIGIIDGRSVWRANLSKKAKEVEDLLKKSSNITLTNSCPLFHLPFSKALEAKLDKELKDRLSFAKEKLSELKLLKALLEGDQNAKKEALELESIFSKELSPIKEIKDRISSLKEKDFERDMPYKERDKLQRDILNLPVFPTTTIGSFPQTEEVRKKRSEFNAGKISKEDYENFVKEQIKNLIAFQEEIGLDVLVHGEFERTDMVEFFAQKLDGIATTEHGWIISYGSRVYRPPIIYGDVRRPFPMTLKEITFAQTLTKKPVKGMLTGPVTILNWSFYRDDIPKREIAYQIALAILDEVKDLEKAGIKIIQIDEPAFREGMPLKEKDRKEYFDWAIKSFRLCSKADPKTQIHTHMCYSEFNEIIKEIYDMDFDVISIEASRSKGEIIKAFEEFKGWDRQIGIGVYDIHSPAIPKVEAMKEVIKRALKVLPKELLWINPDCGLKTRKWEEVIPSLKNMMQMANEVRKEL